MNRQFLNRLKMILGERYEEAVQSFSVDKSPSFRINTLSVLEEEGVARLDELGFAYSKVVGLPNAYILKNKTKREFTDLKEYINGWYYLQSLSSMVPVYCLDERSAKESMVALDMCAAPGSKTSQLAAYMQNEGHIDGYDVSRQRIFQMKSVLGQLRVRNTDIHQADASNIWRKYGPVFDVVLLDAVCSGEGRFKAGDEKSYSDWDLKKVKKMAELQKRLIFSAVMCLKPGGELIYSTCTFSPEENEGVIDFALKKFEGAIEVEKIKMKEEIRSFAEGVTHWEGVDFDPRVALTARIIPDNEWDGFYIAKLRRN